MKNERELLEFQVLRTITNLYKGFLGTVEELSQDHKLQFDKLKKNRKCKLFNEAINSKEKDVEFIEVQEGLTQMSGIDDENYIAKEFINKDCLLYTSDAADE